MKWLLGFVFTALLMTASPSYSQSLQGVWELVEGEYINHEGKLIQYKDLGLKSTKIISGKHFSFVTMSGEKFWSSGSGTFRTDAKQYIENPIYNSFSSPKGKEYVFRYQVENNIWLNSRWENGVRVEFETWRRVN